jgi:O-antigen ligase
MKEHPLFGSGLGSHQVAYKKFTYTNDGKIRLKGFEFNVADANSLFLRLMSETGLIGVIFIIFLVARSFVGYTGDEEDTSWMISGALLVIILLYLLRQGNYFLNGFPVFLWMYYYNKMNYAERLEEKRLAREEAARLAAMRY